MLPRDLEVAWLTMIGIGLGSVRPERSALSKDTREALSDFFCREVLVALWWGLSENCPGLTGALGPKLKPSASADSDISFLGGGNFLIKWG